MAVELDALRLEKLLLDGLDAAFPAQADLAAHVHDPLPGNVTVGAQGV